jgi:AcrR family transcriptional regulator
LEKKKNSTRKTFHLPFCKIMRQRIIEGALKIFIQQGIRATTGDINQLNYRKKESQKEY